MLFIFVNQCGLACILACHGGSRIGGEPISLDWSSYVPVYDRVLCRTATYRALITDVMGRSGPLPALRDGTVILDCGCGTGNLCAAILDQLPAATLVAVDSDATMARCFRDKLADRLSAEPSPGRVCLVESDVIAIFPWLAAHNLQPDYALLVNVLYLLDDPMAALRGIAGSLHPGGELRLSNPDERTDLEALFRQLERDLTDAPHADDVADAFSVLGAFNRERLSSMLHRHSGADLRRLVLDAGFRHVTHSTHDHYAGQSLLISATV